MAVYQRFYHIVRSKTGNLVQGASCAVYDAGTSTLSTIYDPGSDDASPMGISNPFVTGPDGKFGFMALDGEYDISITGGNLATENFRVALNAANMGSSSADQLRADLAASSGAGLVGFSPSTSYPSGSIGYNNKYSVTVPVSPAEQAALESGTLPDLTVALQTAIDNAPIGSTLVLPAGNFKTSTTVYIGKNIYLQGTGTYGSELTYNQHSQWTIPDSGIAIACDPSYVGSGINPKDQYAAGAWQINIKGVKFQGLASSGIASALTLDQICINMRAGWEANIEGCDFRNIGTCVALNGCWAVRASRNLFLDNGYAFRLDPDFALAGYLPGATKFYQANNIVLEENSHITGGYFLYLYGPYNQASVYNNVIQGATQRGILAASYNGALSTAGTDLANKGNGLTVRSNYLESNAKAIQLGKVGTLARSVSAPQGTVIEDNFNTFQGSQIYNLSVVAAVDLSYKKNTKVAYVGSNDVELDTSGYFQRCFIECMNGWDGHFNGDTTSDIRNFDTTYRSWSAFHVDSASGSAITSTTLNKMNAGTSALPFDSLATLNLFIRRVLRCERANANVSVDTVTATIHAGTYAESISFDSSNSGVHTFALSMDAAAGADSISFTGLNIGAPYTLIISGSGKLVLNVNPSTLSPIQVYSGGLLKLDTAKLKYASAGAASTKGFSAYDAGTIYLSGVTNFDANLPYYGLHCVGGLIFKNGTTPSGSNANEFTDQGGLIRGTQCYEPANIQWQGTDYRFTNNNPVLYFGGGSGTTQFQFKGAAGTTRWFDFKTGSTSRASAGVANDAESGSDAGSTYRIRLYSDAGAFVYDALVCGRTSGKAVTADGAWKFAGTTGFNNTAPIAKPTVTGSRGGNAALASLLTALANYGLITDSSTA